MIAGGLAALASAGLWAGASVLFTAEGRRTRPVIMNLVKSGFAAALFLLAWVLVPAGSWGRPAGAWSPPPAALGWLALSGVVGIGLGDTLFFVALDRIGVRRSLMLGLTAPIFAALAATAFGQPLPGGRGALGIGVTLAGLLFFLRAAPADAAAATGTDAGAEEAPSRRSAAPRRAALACGLGAALCQGLGIVLTKEAIAEAGLLPSSVIRLLAGAASVLLVELLRGRVAGLGPELGRGFTRGRLLLAAFGGTFVAFALFQLAILLGSPPVTAALTATSPILAAPFAVRFLGERLPRATWLGTLVAVAGVVLVLLD